MKEPRARDSTSRRGWTRWFRGWRLGLLAFVALLGLCLEPQSGGAMVREALRAEAWRRGWRFDCDAVRGSLAYQLVIDRPRLSSRVPREPLTTLRAERMTARFSLLSLFGRRKEQWFRELEIVGARWQIDYRTGSNVEAAEIRPVALAVAPSEVVLRDCAVVLERDADHFSVTGITAAFRDRETPFYLEAVTIETGGWQANFHELAGTASLRDGRATIRGLTLGHNAQLDFANADLRRLAEGRWTLETQFSAFGGTVRGELEHVHDVHSPIAASLRALNVNVAGAAEFFGLRGDPGGVLHEGNARFRGSLAELEQATLSFHIDAGDFQWGNRRWQSLRAGATLVGGRLEVPELELRQEKNSARFNGELRLPERGRAWWEGELKANFDAQIEDLTEFSTLVNPHYDFVAGQGTLRGVINGRAPNFEGEVHVSGHDLLDRGTPIENLQSTITFRGDELEIGDLQITNGADFLRGRGRFNVSGDHRYAGELKGSVADLSLYAALWPKRLLPVLPAGGLSLDWSGDGTMSANSGAFRAEFDGLRSLEGELPKLLPINAELEGTYSPDSLYFSRFRLTDRTSTLNAMVIVRPQSFHLQEIELRHGDDLWLEGEMTLPIRLSDFWAPEALRQFVVEDGAVWIQLHADRLPVERALPLVGLPPPLSGNLTGALEIFGKPTALAGTGTLSFRDGHWNSSPSGAQNRIEGDATLAGPWLRIKQLVAPAFGTEVEGAGSVDLGDWKMPKVDLDLRAKNWSWWPTPDLALKGDATLHFSSAPGAGFSGELMLTDARFLREWSARTFLQPEPLPAIAVPLWADWPLHGHLTTPKPLAVWPANGFAMPNQPARVAADLQLTGTATAPEIHGTVELAAFPLGEALRITQGKIWIDDRAAQWVLETHGGGVLNEAREGYLHGSTDEPHEIFWNPAQLNSPDTVDLWAGAGPPPPFFTSMAESAADPFPLVTLSLQVQPPLSSL